MAKKVKEYKLNDTISVVPSGGTVGQVVIKQSSTEGDVAWGSGGDVLLGAVYDPTATDGLLFGSLYNPSA